MKEARKSSSMAILIAINVLLLVVIVAWFAGDYVQARREEDAQIKEASLDMVESGAATQSEAEQVWRLLLAAEKGRTLSNDEAEWLLGLLTKDYGQLEYQRQDFFRSYIYRTFELAPVSRNQELEDEIAQAVVSQLKKLLMDERYFSAAGMPLRVLGARNRSAELRELADLATHPNAQIVAEYKAARAALK